MRVAALIVAAGKGERLGADRPKQFLELVDGKTMLDVSIAAVLACPVVHEVVVAVPPGFLDRVASSDRVRVVEGGERRQDSVARAFARASADADVIVIHDAARPFVSAALIARTVDAALAHGAAIAAVAATDTVKQTPGGEGTLARLVHGTLSRDTIFLAQTPQAFRRQVLVDAMAAGAEMAVTDEAMLVERAGLPVYLVDGEAGNMKVTTAEDLAAARARLAGRRDGSASMTTMRIGTGYDLHRLVEGRPLILGGVHLPFDKGLDGHSDADIVCHAVTDAVLGAAAAGDIGRFFPDTDMRWKDADSLRMLRRAVEVVHEAGFAVVNVDVTVIAERPKLLPYLDRMRGNLAAALGIDVERVSIKGKTGERVDAVGREEAMACHAVALLVGK